MGRVLPWLRTGRARSVLLQAAAVVAALLAAGWLAGNLQDNLERRSIGIGFGFLGQPAGFDIPWRLLDWEVTSTYARAFLVSGANTLFVSALAIALASVVGLLVALARLSRNPLLGALARAYVELVRNTPQLVQIVFWYFAVLQILPAPRASIRFGGAALNVRGLFLPAPEGGVLGPAVVGAVLLALLPRLPALARAAILATGVVTGCALETWSLPVLRGFNYAGGVRLPPELLALMLGIGLYASAFVAETVRGSILGVPPGQAEAARSLGLSAARTMRLVVLPQALRTMLPPLTSQYLNVIKSSTLGAAVAFPEVVQIFARTVLNQSGRAIEVMLLLLGAFLLLNLGISALIGALDRRLAIRGAR